MAKKATTKKAPQKKRYALRMRKRNAPTTSDPEDKGEKVMRKLTSSRVLKAIPGTGGILTRLAKRLECSYSAIHSFFQKCNDPDVLEAWSHEKEYIGDIAEQTIQESMMQRLDLSEASKTARWYLEKRHKDRGYVDAKQLTLEGGKVPLSFQQETIVSVDALDALPLDTRRQILAALREKEEADKQRASHADK